MSIKLKPCPFCGSDKIAYSIKSKGAYYHISHYCKKCHAYGPRVTIRAIDTDYSYTYKLRKETESELAKQSAEKWNNQVADKSIAAINEFADNVIHHYSSRLYQPTPDRPIVHTMVDYLKDFIGDIRKVLLTKYQQ